MNIGNKRHHVSPLMRNSVNDESVFEGVDFNEVVVATAATSALGAFVGGIAGHSSAQSDIKEIPRESVTLTWKEPVTKRTTIGKIPQDQYFPAERGFLYSECDDSPLFHRPPSVNPDLRPTEPVVREVPVLDDLGNPVFRSVTKTFSNHGKPIVSTYTHTVTTPRLDSEIPFSQSLQDDTRLVSCHVGTDEFGNPQTDLKSVLNGVEVSFEPNVVEERVDSPNSSYQTKTVDFDHGVDVGGKVLRGVLVGAGVGAVVGLAGDLAKQILLERNR